MTTHTIPPEHWISFFDQFSRDHAGWPATVEVLDKQAGPQNVAEDLPLEGISFETRGTRASAVDISVGNWSRRHVNHVVDTPLHIREMDSDGSIDLQFEPAIGPMTLVHLWIAPAYAGEAEGRY